MAEKFVPSERLEGLKQAGQNLTQNRRNAVLSDLGYTESDLTPKPQTWAYVLGFGLVGSTLLLAYVRNRKA